MQSKRKMKNTPITTTATTMYTRTNNGIMNYFSASCKETNTEMYVLYVKRVEESGVYFHLVK